MRLLTDSALEPDLPALHKQGSVQLPTVGLDLAELEQGSFHMGGADENSHLLNFIICSTVLCDMSVCLKCNNKKVYWTRQP